MYYGMRKVNRVVGVTHMVFEEEIKEKYPDEASLREAYSSGVKEFYTSDDKRAIGMLELAKIIKLGEHQQLEKDIKKAKKKIGKIEELSKEKTQEKEKLFECIEETKKRRRELKRSERASKSVGQYACIWGYDGFEEFYVEGVVEEQDEFSIKLVDVKKAVSKSQIDKLEFDFSKTSRFWSGRYFIKVRKEVN